MNIFIILMCFLGFPCIFTVFPCTRLDSGAREVQAGAREYSENTRKIKKPLQTEGNFHFSTGIFLTIIILCVFEQLPTRCAGFYDR